jgi:hypothetical protein
MNAHIGQLAIAELGQLGSRPDGFVRAFFSHMTTCS